MHEFAMKGNISHSIELGYCMTGVVVPISRDGIEIVVPRRSRQGRVGITLRATHSCSLSPCHSKTNVISFSCFDSVFILFYGFSYCSGKMC